MRGFVNGDTCQRGVSAAVVCSVTVVEGGAMAMVVHRGVSEDQGSHGGGGRGGGGSGGGGSGGSGGSGGCRDGGRWFVVVMRVAVNHGRMMWYRRNRLL